MVDVTPPPFARVPRNIDPELNKYLIQLNRILLQLWTRTGGEEDLIDFSAEGEDNNNQIAYLMGQINDLREALECVQCDSKVVDLNPLLDRIAALESDITPIYIPEPAEASSSASKDYAHFYLTGAGVTGVAATATTLTINGTGEVSNSLASLASDEITIAKTGIYSIDVSVYFNSGGSSRSEYSKWIEVDDGGGYAEAQSTRFATYQRGYDAGTSGSMTTILNLTTGDKIRLRVQRTSGSATTGYQDANGTSIVIKEL